MNNYKYGKVTREKLVLMKEIIRENDEFIILDIETTGLSPQKGGRIIEIGAVRIINGSFISEFSSFINPEMKIPKKIMNLTGITNDMVEGAEVYQSVLPNFHKFIGKTPIVAHNAGFDWDRFLVPFMNRLGIYPENDVIDTMVLAKGILPAKEGDKMNLGAVCERCDVSLINAHRAIDDARATAELFKIAKKEVKREMGSQESLFNVFDESELKLENGSSEFLRPGSSEMKEKQIILGVNPWDKTFGKRRLYRLYVNLPKAKIFYDVINHRWEIKETKVELDLDQIEKDVKLYLEENNPSLLELIA